MYLGLSRRKALYLKVVTFSQEVDAFLEKPETPTYIQLSEGKCKALNCTVVRTSANVKTLKGDPCLPSRKV